MSNNLVIKLVGWIFALLSAVNATWALDSDREQPIQIVADVAVRDEVAGETRYEGNVVLTQGSLQITAEKLSIQHTESGADRIVATGSPATLIQQPTPDQTPVDASAQRIEYIRSEDLVRLLENARIAQNGSTLSGNQIDYLVSQRSVRAKGTPGASGEGRVEVVIPPEILRNNGTDA
ncbi:lipopolysaccharide transport periplasmic protein LptA [Luminiphilus sp.]|nr:lipopolysaccharide transport periplasmic protein LptA [Luminiphilus sp.]MDA9710830.1 lipopolysaccharide transport periplasmic protein LptA [Luminiphilus sp.]